MGSLSKQSSVAVVTVLVEQVLPLLSAADVPKRQGAVEAVACLVDSLGIQVVPYAVLMVVPLLGKILVITSQIYFYNFAIAIYQKEYSNICTYSYKYILA